MKKSYAVPETVIVKLFWSVGFLLAMFGIIYGVWL